MTKRKTQQIKSLRGMKDILPKDQVCWEWIRKITRKAASDFDFQRIDTPIVEMAALFERTVGEGTDIVEKEMYTFYTKGKDRITLRPEFTASIARAYIENGMHRFPKPVKLYSIGPIFRYERPQEGRYRQHYQASFEVFGRRDSLLDAQMIQLARYILNKTGIKETCLLVNSIGCLSCRKPYVRSLVAYLKRHKSELCPSCKKRLTKNPFRILDCKDQKCQEIIEEAPQMINSLCEKCHNHFKLVLEYLDELELEYIIDPTLVRGLDYYTNTVFEFTNKDEDLEKKGLTLIGGGRYNKLIKNLGGENTSAMGFAMGMERIIEELYKLGIDKKLKQKAVNKNLVFLAQLGELGKKESIKLFNSLQNSGISTSESFGRGSIKSQLKSADRIRAKVTLIIGQKEALEGTVIMKDMETGNQEVIAQENIIKRLKTVLRKKKKKK